MQLEEMKKWIILHSIYVDQWDWEKIIKKEDRNENTLKETVKTNI